MLIDMIGWLRTEKANQVGFLELVAAQLRKNPSSAFWIKERALAVQDLQKTESRLFNLEAAFQSEMGRVDLPEAS